MMQVMGTRATHRACRLAVLVSAMASLQVAAQSPAQREIYKDPAALIEQRVEDLLARMTLPEKIAQITSVWTNKNELLDPQGNFDPAAARRLFPAGIGQFARPSDRQQVGSPFKTPFRDERETVELVNAIQRHAVRNT